MKKLNAFYKTARLSCRTHFPSCLVTGILVGAMACAGTVSAANPDHATFTFGGAIVGGACKISVQPVPLGKHMPSEFSGVGGPLSWVNFNIDSEGCDLDVVTLHMEFDGTADANNAKLFALSPGGASGVGVELQAQDGRVVTPNGTGTALLSWTPVAIGSSYPMRARYIQTLPKITVGPANSTATIILTYN
ncbi:fimbrial protein [Collimonas sp. NPDC087041]|uniref:fimbrial protein n=1 Tax=Collimonas sp. NPDC087041 TaxID=3363960 RepID=UPI00382508DD